MSRIIILLISFFFVSCSETKNNSEDIIKIGNQTWMKNNLDVITFRNGDSILYAQTNEEWEQARFAQQPAWCYFKNDPDNGSKFGKLYNWYAVNDHRGLAPKGWKIPSDSDWTQLAHNTKGKMFSVQRGGTRTFIGEFENEGMGYWWSSTGNETHDAQYAWYSVVGKQNDSLYRASYVKGSGFSVRCLKN